MCYIGIYLQQSIQRRPLIFQLNLVLVNRSVSFATSPTERGRGESVPRTDQPRGQWRPAPRPGAAQPPGAGSVGPRQEPGVGSRDWSQGKTGAS